MKLAPWQIGLLAIAILIGCVLFSTFHTGWKPPQNPNPSEIFKEAKADAAAGKYADALAKHVWFHQNALKYDEGLYGVRLSYALDDWVELGAKYPPALKKLRSIRDGAAEKVRVGKDIREPFNDFESINEALKENNQTKDLFVWLDATNPIAAKEVYDLAQPALIQAKEYKLCGKYIDMAKTFDQILYRYNTAIRVAGDKQVVEQKQALINLAEQSYSEDSATLVALLVLNERMGDANWVADEALKWLNKPELKKELEEAKKGQFPPPPIK